MFFCLRPGILAMVRLPATNPAKQLTFLLFISAEGKESPLPFWGPSQSLGFYLPPLPVSGDLRLLSTNTCLYPLCDLDSFLTVTYLTGCHCSFQREDSINLISIVSVGYHMTLASWSFLTFFIICDKNWLFLILYEKSRMSSCTSCLIRNSDTLISLAMNPVWLSEIVVNHDLDLRNKFGSSFLNRTIRERLRSVRTVVIPSGLI